MHTVCHCRRRGMYISGRSRCNRDTSRDKQIDTQIYRQTGRYLLWELRSKTIDREHQLLGIKNRSERRVYVLSQDLLKSHRELSLKAIADIDGVYIG